MIDFDDPNPPDHQDADDTANFTRALQIVDELTRPAAPLEADTEHELAWTDIQLGTILTNGDTVTPPAYLTRTDGHALIYPARHHDIHGEPGDGKSWVALAALREVVLTGRAAIWVDWEDTATAFISRLRALGLEDALIGDPTCIRFIRPDGPFGTLDRAALLELAKTIDAGLIVFDAMADALALDGLDENSNRDGVLWLTRICRPFNWAGITTIVLDHVSRDPATRTRGARGGGSKLGFIDGVSYALKLVKPFDRETPGEIQLKIAKDRDGRVGPRGKIVARITVTPHNHGEQLDLAILPADTNTDDEGRFYPTHLMEAISRLMERHPGEAFSGRFITDGIKGNAKFIREGLSRLVELGHIETFRGDRGATMHTLTDPYREPDNQDDGAPSDPARPSASQRVPDAVESSASPDPLSFGGDAVDGTRSNTQQTGSASASASEDEDPPSFDTEEPW